MHVFMLSLDRALVGEGTHPVPTSLDTPPVEGIGDAVERHREYGKHCERLTIIVPTPPGYQHTQLTENVEAYPTNARSWLGHEWVISRYFGSVLEHTGIDLIVAQDLLCPLASLLSARYKVPIIVNVHGVWWDEWFTAKRWWHRWYLPWMTQVMKRADGVRVVSKELKEVLARKGVAQNKIHVIPTPVEVRRFINDARRQSFQTRSLAPAGSLTQEACGKSRPSDTMPDLPRNGLEGRRLAQREDKTELIVLSVGRLEKEKGFDVLLRAWEKVSKEVPHARIFIIGDGSERQRLKDLASRLNITESALFLGPVPSVELPPYYHRAAFFALASHSESFGKVLVEAGAACLPVVATNTLGARSIVLNGKTGVLAPVRDEKAIAEKIIYLLKNPDKAREMGNRAQEHIVKTFDYKKNVEKIVRLWRQIIKT